MTLTEKARAAAEAVGYEWLDKTHPFVDDMTDAMVKLARDHAENACEEMRWCDGDVRAALQAAEDAS